MKRNIFIALLVLICMTNCSYAQPADKVLLAAASDLKFALDSLITHFKKSNNGTFNVTYGSSGKLFEQISHGAPFDIFFSADIDYPRQLKKNGLTASEIVPYGVGRIVLWSKRMNPQKEGMKSLLLPDIKKVAMANPIHAPYGKRAQEALIYYELLEQVQEKLVFGENISQAAQFTTTGAADIGIVALSLALSPNMKKEGGTYYLIPETSHTPLVQGAVVTQHGSENNLATSFMRFMKSNIATDILIHFGFTKP